MVDRREDILVRLQAIAVAVVGKAESVWRNNSDFSTAPRPGIVILDGEETSKDGEVQNRPANKPRRITMTPAIILLKSGQVAAVGPDVNALRAQMLKAMFQDTTLLGLVLDGNDRGIDYHGCSANFAQGALMEGDMSLNISFTYPLRIDEL